MTHKVTFKPCKDVEFSLTTASSTEPSPLTVSVKYGDGLLTGIAFDLTAEQTEALKRWVRCLPVQPPPESTTEAVRNMKVSLGASMCGEHQCIRPFGHPGMCSNGWRTWAAREGGGS